MAEYLVLDVSKYNTINDYSAAAAEIDGVIMRTGYRGYGASGTLVKDNLFDTHIAGFSGKTKIGVYWFTQAISEAEAIAEANYVYNIIKNHDIDFPVYIDSEYSNNNHDGRADSLSKDDRTKYIIAFCDRIIELGYRAGVYASDSWYKSNLDLSQLYDKEYSLWVARYSTESPIYVTGYDGWQYTSSGSLSGIPGRVDLSHFYNDIAGWITTEDTIDLNDVNYDIEYFSTIYTGYELKPKVEFYALTEGKDYTVYYVDNIDVGIAKAVCTGIGPLYSGTVTIEYTILTRDINEFELVLSNTVYQYNGTEREPVVLLGTLIEGVDFKVRYTDNINVGQATVIVEGINNYTGIQKDNFKINPLDISGMICYLDPPKAKYTGQEVKPKMYVSQLDEGTEYTVSYYNNIEIGTKAKATATGIGNYIGSVSLFFEISDMDIIDLNPRLITTKYNYTGAAYYPEVVFDIPVTEGIDYTLKYENNINAGIGTVIVYGIGTYSSYITLNFTIERINISNKKIKLEAYSFNYESDYITPEFELEDLVKNKDYKVTYSNNKNSGTAKVTVEGINNYIGTISDTFEILYTKIQNCVAKLGIPSVNTIYRIDGPFKLYANQNKYEKDIALVEGTDYNIIEEIRIPYADFTLVCIKVKGLNGFTDTAEYNFRVIYMEPDPNNYIDDGTYNFGYIDEPASETAEGMYDFGCLDCGVDPENIANGDYDFDKLSGMYLDAFDEDTGSNINKEGESKDESSSIEDLYPDDGTYNFGFIDISGSETAEGDYDFGCLDCGISSDTAVIDGKDYDFNKFADISNSYGILAGDSFKLIETKVYAGHHSLEVSFEYSGIIYIYNSDIVNDMIRIARIEDAVESPARVLGWCKVKDLMSLDIIPIGEKVIVTGKLYENNKGEGGYIEKAVDIMYIVDYIEEAESTHPYRVANNKFGAGVGFASRDMLELFDETT